MTAAILAAGGSGHRVGADLPKQFVEIDGKSLLRRSFEAIAEAGLAHIVVVVPPDRVAQAETIVPEATAVVAGGDTRQASVRAGLAAVKTDTVLVHDAARPFAPASVFHSVLAALDDADAAVPGLQMKETVKVVRDGVVVQTLAREEIWNIQTPQAFRTAALRDAHARALTDGVAGTDDAQLIEHYGGTVAVVPGSPLAFKVTDSADLRRAAAIAGGETA